MSTSLLRGRKKGVYYRAKNSDAQETLDGLRQSRGREGGARGFSKGCGQFGVPLVLAKLP